MRETRLRVVRGDGSFVADVPAGYRPVAEDNRLMARFAEYATWQEAHEKDPAHRDPGGKFGCPICLRRQLDTSRKERP